MSASKPSSNDPRPKRSTALPRLFLVVVLASPIALAALLEPPSEGGKAPTVGGITLPPMCVSKVITGEPCPGCGLTRSWITGIRGDATLSYRYNRLGLPLMLYVLLQILRQTSWLLFRNHRPLVERWGRRLDWCLVVLAVLLMLNYMGMLLGLLEKSIAFGP